MTKKAIIFTRVSSQEQEEGHSIEAQKCRLLEYCKRNELDVIKSFEIVESSTKGDRKKFKEMINFATKQRETVAIVADKVDRVQRRISEIPMLEQPVKSGKIELHFRTEGYIIDKDSQSHAKLMWGMNVLMAQAYTDTLSDNVKRSLDHLIRNGKSIGPAPLGYINAHNDNNERTVIPDPSRSEIIKRIFQEYATGNYTMSEMVKKAKEWGLRSKKGNNISKSTLHELLQNPFYYGEMKIKGELWTHFYEPLISFDTFELCRSVREGWHKKPFKYAGKDFVFRGILKCAVSGRVVSSDTKKKKYADGTVGEWTYLVAYSPDNPDKKVWVREDKIIDEVKEILKRIGFSDYGILQDVLCILKKTNEAKKKSHNEELGQLKREHTLLQEKLDRLLDLRLEEEISKDEYNQQKARFKTRQYEVGSLISKYDEADDKFTDILTILIELADNAYKHFMGSKNEEKRKMLNFLFSNLSLRGKKLEYALRPPFDMFEKIDETEKWLPGPDSNQRPIG